jgi:hypothetical protein
MALPCDLVRRLMPLGLMFSDPTSLTPFAFGR